MGDCLECNQVQPQLDFDMVLLSCGQPAQISPCTMLGGASHEGS